MGSSGLTYWDALKIEFTSNPLDTLSSAAGAIAQSGIYAFGGYVSPGAKADLATSEANNLVQASAGSLTFAEAYQQALNDVTGALTQAGADPSLAPDWLEKLGTYINYALILAAIYVVYKVLTLVVALK